MQTHKQSQKAGLPPGALVYIGQKRSDTTRITVCGYNETTYWEEQTEDREETIALLKREDTVRWVSITGLARIEMLQVIGERFKLHPLTLEDILNTDQRPKQEVFEDYIYISLKMLVSKEADDSVEMEQVSLILGVDYVLSFSESGDEIFKPVRDRIHNNKSSIRSKGPDYLTYALLDSVVDGYYAVLEKVGENIEVLEDKLLTDPSQKTLHDVHRIKGVMLNIRHAVWPLREVLTGLEQSDSAFVNHDTALHMRDVYFHAVQIIDTIEIYREMLSGMLDIYLSSVNNKMNEVMKVLTIFAAIFIPLTLISGIYGMNFKYMPELNWPFGYPLSIALMLVVTGFMLLYFKRKGWL